MVYLEIIKTEYECLKEYLAQYFPEVKIELLVCDDNLENLGFCKSAPCRVAVDVDNEMVDDIMEHLMDFEIDAFNTKDGKHPKDNNPHYILYRKYGWLWDLFYNSKVVD